MDETPGRCISCGFLAYQPGLATVDTQYQEVQPNQRETPETLYRPREPDSRQIRERIGLSSLPPDRINERYLVCFRQKADLPTEMKNRCVRRDPASGQPVASVSAHVAVRETLLMDRRCPEYVRYVVGLTPKDHLMERRVTSLEEDRRTFQATMDKGGKRLTIAALILGSLLALGQIIAALVAMTPDSYAAKWFQGMWSPPAQTAPKK